MSERLPVGRDVLEHELESCITLLQRWLLVVKREGVIEGGHELGFPCLDYPSTEEILYATMQQMSRELVLCSGRCETLADVLYSAR